MALRPFAPLPFPGLRRCDWPMVVLGQPPSSEYLSTLYSLMVEDGDFGDLCYRTMLAYDSDDGCTPTLSRDFTALKFYRAGFKLVSEGVPVLDDRYVTRPALLALQGLRIREGSRLPVLHLPDGTDHVLNAYRMPARLA